MQKFFVLVFYVTWIIPAALGQQWEFKAITDGSKRDAFPRISGSSVAWQRHDGHDWEIFYFDGAGISQLTDNDVDDQEADVSNGHVAWIRGKFDNADIVYDGTAIMSGVGNQTDMKLEPGGMIWSAVAYPFSVAHVYLFDGTATKRLSVDGTYANHNPDMSGNRVVWSSFNGGKNSAYLFDGTTAFELPENVGLGQVPKISGNHIVGVGSAADGINDQVFLYDGVSNMPLGNTSTHDLLPSIAGDNVAWSSCGGNVCEIFTFHEGQAKQLSFNSVRTYAPVVSESFVVFNVYDGSDWEIFAFDGMKTTRLTDNDLDDVVYDISGDTFVGLRGGRNQSQIFTMTYVVPEPSSFLVIGLLLKVGVLSRRRCASARCK
jgi:hypothetical protein